MAEEEAIKMDVDDTTTGNVTLSQGLEEIFQAGESFAKCEINVSTLFTTKTDGQHSLNASEDGFLELSCLDQLRRGSGGEFLMPARVFVRSEMQAMFCNLLTKATPRENKRILTGSAGIGKSVLLFLVALRFQLLPEQATKKISFIRKVKESDNISLYIMEPGEPPGTTIRVVFCHTMSKADYPSNFELWKTVRGYTKALKTSDYQAFVDGPIHTETMDLLNTSYRFFCTSGGYPTVSQAEIMTTIVSILTGWKESTICSFLTKIGQTAAQAQEIYSYSGGRIRLAVMGMQQEGKVQIRKWFDDLLSGFGPEKIQLAITKTDSHASTNSSDRLRTRFIDYDGKGTSLLIVDSQYAMSRLRDRLDVGDFVSSYNLATVCGLQSARGWFFEEIMHLWLKRKGVPLIEDWIRSVGNAAEGIKDLDREKRYWIPATSNFANIDAAFVYQHVLVCIQYTVRRQHGFDKATFWQDFAGRVHTVVPFSAVAVWFVSPNGTDFQNTHEGYNQAYAAGSLPLVPVSFGTAEVACASTDILDMAAPEMAFLNEEMYRNEQE